MLLARKDFSLLDHRGQRLLGLAHLLLQLLADQVVLQRFLVFAAKLLLKGFFGNGDFFDLRL